jgi:TRAP-type C4-dicarboxylate transport system permease small subunit
MKRIVLTLTGALAVPLACLLFAQWPLRDAVQAYSRQTNDVAQMVFAVYAAVAITAASYSNSHLALTKPAVAAPHWIAKWRALAMLVCVGPWSLFLLWSAFPHMLRSVRGLEKFSEGLTPGYFVLRVALVLLALLVLLHAVEQVLDAWRERGASPP